MSSGSSATEMKKPTKDRTTRVNRCHIESSCSGTLRYFRCGRRRIDIARRNGVFADKISDRLGDLLFFLLFLEPPTSEAFFLTRNFFVVGLDLRTLFGYILVDLALQIAVFFHLARFQFFGGALLHPLEGIESAVAPNRILDNFFNIDAGSIECHQN